VEISVKNRPQRIAILDHGSPHFITNRISFVKMEKIAFRPKSPIIFNSEDTKNR
jgi:hypothetical protein